MGATREQDSQKPKEKGELSPLAKIVLSVTAVGIVWPFIIILWAWAGSVVRDMGF